MSIGKTYRRLVWLNDNPEATANDMAAAFKITPRAARSWCKTMMAERVIDRRKLGGVYLYSMKRNVRL